MRNSPGTGFSAVDGTALTRWLGPFAEALGLADDPWGIRLHHLKQPRDIARVAHLRDHIDLELHRALDPRFEEHEQRRDQVGVTVAFEARGELIGTIRAVPMRHGLTLTEKLIDAVPALTAARDDWEMGRLVLDPRFRAGPDLLRHCLYLALSFLDRRERVEGLHASCTPVLARLYRRLGFEVTAQDVPLAGSAKTYTLIHGPFERVLEALSAGEDTAWQAPPLFGPTRVSQEVFP